MRSLILFGIVFFTTTFLVGQNYLRIDSQSFSQKGTNTVSLDYSGAFGIIKNNLDLLGRIKCQQKIEKQFNEKIIQERLKINTITEYLVIIDEDDCNVMLSPYKGSTSVLSDNINTLKVFILDLLPNRPLINSEEKIALVVTWQTESGKWKAGGPIQWFSGESEKDAMKYVYNNRKGEPYYARRVGKYNLYVLPYNLENWHTDIRKKLLKEGIDIDDL